MKHETMMFLLALAIMAAQRPDSTTPLRQEHVTMKRIPETYRKPLPIRKVRRWPGIFEHKDTPSYNGKL